MKTKKQPLRHIAHFPKKGLRIRPLAKKGGVSQRVVDQLLNKARKSKDAAYPMVRVARFMALGKFARAYKAAERYKFKGLATVRPVLVRAVKTINPRFYAKRIAA